MAWEILNNIIIPLLQWISYIVALGTFIVIIVTYLFPPWVSMPIKKAYKKFTLRNSEFSFNVEKSFKVKKSSLEPNELREELKNILLDIFSKFNINIIDKEHNQKLSAILERDKFNIKIDFLITPKGENPEEEYGILVRQSTKTKFKSIEKCLNIIFWNLISLKDKNIDLIEPISNNVEVSIDAEGLTIFKELFEVAGTNIIGSNISLSQKNKHTFIRIRDEFEIEFAEKVKNFIALGHV